LQHANRYPPANACREFESVHTIKWTSDNKKKYFRYKQKHTALYLSVNECDTNAQHSYKLFMGKTTCQCSIEIIIAKGWLNGIHHFSSTVFISETV